MSLFDSIYDAPEDGAEVPAPVAPRPGDDDLAPIAVPEAAPASPCALGDPEAPPSPVEPDGQALEVLGAPTEGPETLGGARSMSLQDFAAEVFGKHGDPGGTRPQPSPFAAALNMATETEGEPPAPEPPEPHLDGLEALETTVATRDPSPGEPVASFHGGDSATDEGASNEGGAFPELPLLQPLMLVDDDLLPGLRGRRSRSLSAPSLPGGGAGSRMTAILVIVVALMTGFLGFRTLAGSGNPSESSDASTGADQAGAVAGADQLPNGPAAALDAAQLAAAEVDLRNAALQAQANFAQTQSFAADWGQLLGRTVVEAATPVGTDVLQSVSDADAACFQIGLMNGATVAAGVTAERITFSSDAGGASICTADATVLSGWPAVLTPGA